MADLTFTKFATGFLKLPATIFSSIISLTFGYTEIKGAPKKPLKNNKKELTNEEQDELSLEANSKKNPLVIIHDGILGTIFNGIKYATRAVSDFIAQHKTAIATAFWMSLLVAGGLALTLFLWPAALTAVSSFSVLGLSIAGIVGANSLLQIGCAAGLAFAATSLLTYLTAGIVNTIVWIKNACCSAPETPSDESSDLDMGGSSSQLGLLNQSGSGKQNKVEDMERAPYHGTGVLSRKGNKKEQPYEVINATTMELH